MKQAGLYGGSFNPLHNGHLHLAESVWQALGLDYVLLMPAGEAPHKSCDAYAAGKHRAAMCRLAAAERPWLRVSDYEIRKPGKSYTIDTLHMLYETCPDTAWTLLLGSDMLLSFDTWRNWQGMMKIARICAVSREADDLPLLNAKAEALTAQVPGSEIRVLNVPAVPVSSTQIRRKLRAQEDCSCLLPKNVVEYIMKNGLYTAGGDDSEQGN